MSRLSSRRFAWIAPVIVALLAMAGCRREAPETALRHDVARLQVAIEQRDAGAVAESLAEDFIGPGGMDRQAARRLAVLQFMRSTRVTVQSGPLGIRMQGDTARVDSVVLLGGGDGLLPERGQALRVVSAWRREGDHWRLVSIDWQPVGQGAEPQASDDRKMPTGLSG